MFDLSLPMQMPFPYGLPLGISSASLPTSSPTTSSPLGLNLNLSAAAASVAATSAANWVANLNLPNDLNASLVMLETAEAELQSTLDRSTEMVEKIRGQMKDLAEMMDTRATATASLDIDRQRLRQIRLEEVLATPLPLVLSSLFLHLLCFRDLFSSPFAPFSSQPFLPTLLLLI